MKHYLRKLILTSASFYAAFLLVPTITLGSDPMNLVYLLGGLFVISVIINPIFSLVLLPLNFLTFGLFMFILHIGFIVALINFLPEFAVGPFNFVGANVYGIIIPTYNFNKTLTIVLIAIVITVLQKVFDYIFD